MINASCPQCASRIEILKNPKVGQYIQCQQCQTNLVITWLYPISLDFIEESGPKGLNPTPPTASGQEQGTG
jgi:hypothetical protein